MGSRNVGCLQWQELRNGMGRLLHCIVKSCHSGRSVGQEHCSGTGCLLLQSGPCMASRRVKRPQAEDPPFPPRIQRPSNDFDLHQPRTTTTSLHFAIFHYTQSSNNHSSPASFLSIHQVSLTRRRQHTSNHSSTNSPHCDIQLVAK